MVVGDSAILNTTTLRKLQSMKQFVYEAAANSVIIPGGDRRAEENCHVEKIKRFPS